MLGNGKEGCGDSRPCLLLCPVLMALEKEEEGGPSSSEEEEEEEEDVALDSDMEQVSERNVAAYSDQASRHPLNIPHSQPQEKPTARSLLSPYSFMSLSLH